MLKDSKNLFPITKIIPSADGYFMDAQGEVWSERGRKNLLKLQGSTTSSGRYVTMQTSGFQSSFKLNDLQRRCRSHKQWAEDTRPVPQAPARSTPVVVASPNSLANALGLSKSPVKIEVGRIRNHAVNAAQGIAARGWVIASVKGGQLSFSAEPTIHTTEISVNSELDRLAKQSPGVKYVKLQIQAAVTVGAVQWE